MNDYALISPYGGKLIDLLVAVEEAEELRSHASKLPSVQLSDRSVCDLEMLAVGAFSPLERFMGKRDYDRVLEEMRLADGTLFPIPITFPIREFSGAMVDKDIALRSPKNELIAIMTVEEVFHWNPGIEALLVCGSDDTRHPLVAEMGSWGRTFISGPLRVVNLPKHYDFADLRRTPEEVRRLLLSMGYPNVVASDEESHTPGSRGVNQESR